MTQVIRAHYDGSVIVPDQPVDLLPGEALEVSIRRSAAQSSQDAARSALQRLAGRALPNLDIPDSALRRENMYEEPR